MKSPARLDTIFVSIQFLLFIIYLIPVHALAIQFLPLVAYIGGGIAAVGILVIIVSILQLSSNLSPFPTPKEKGVLIRSGLYKVIRHPIYTGIILGSIGLGVFLESGWKILIGISLWGLFYVKSRYEEKLLAEKYAEYEAYKMDSGRFFPFV